MIFRKFVSVTYFRTGKNADEEKADKCCLFFICEIFNNMGVS